MMESNPDGTFNVPENGEAVHPIFTGGLKSVFFDSWIDIKLTKSNGNVDNVFLPQGTPITCLNLNYIDDLNLVNQVQIKYRD